MDGAFRRSLSSARNLVATCGTTTISACIRRWAINRPLTMNAQARRTHVSTEPREDPGGWCNHEPLRLKTGVRPTRVLDEDGMRFVVIVVASAFLLVGGIGSVRQRKQRYRLATTADENGRNARILG